MAEAAALPPLREVIKAYGLGADKRLGQHFLLDLNVTAKIARAAGDLAGATVFEIGPGPGGLTRALLATEATRIVAIEKDPRCVAALQQLAEASAGRLTVIEGDALAVDLAALAPAPRAIVANLPYNIATPLFIRWLKQISAFESLTLMFQREVALRLVAAPRSPDYGRLSVMTQWLADPNLLFDLPPQAFTPPPKVTSSVVRIVPGRHAEPQPSFEAMERVVAAAFGQRRKMLRTALKTLVPNPLPLLERTEIDPTRRAEELTVGDFSRLADAWRAGPEGAASSQNQLSELQGHVR